MNYCIAESKDMNAPSDNIIIFIFIHIFPCKFMCISQNKIMNMESCSSCKDISLGTQFSSPTWCRDLNFNSIYIVFFKVCKAYNNFFKTVIRSSIKNYTFMLRFISNVSNIDCTKFKEFSFWTLWAFQKLFLSFLILGDIKDCIKCCFICFCILNRLLWLKDNLFRI